METHIKTLGWIHIALGIPGTIIAFVLMVFGLVAGTALGSIANSAGAGIMGTGVISAVVLVIFCLPILGIVTGYGLVALKSYGRSLGIIVSVVDIIAGFFGMFSVVAAIIGLLLIALGIYGLVVLSNKESLPLFQK